MIMEMRVSRCLPGRLPALMKRFDTLTLKLWDKHGIKQAGFYTTLIGTSNQELTYFIAWDSLADREKKWATFQTDPDWIAGRAKSEEDGQIVDIDDLAVFLALGAAGDPVGIGLERGPFLLAVGQRIPGDEISQFLVGGADQRRIEAGLLDAVLVPQFQRQ